MTFPVNILGVIFIMLLSACGDDILTDSDLGPGSPLNLINDFTVVGSGAPDMNTGSVPIDATFNSGQFSINWDVTSSNPYDFKVFVGSSSLIGDAMELMVGSAPCIGSNCNSNLSFDCSLTVTNVGVNEIACSDNAALDVSAINTGNIFLQVCRGGTSECVNKSVPITII